MRFKNWMLNEDADISYHESSDGFEMTYNATGVQGSIYAKKDPDNPGIYRVTRVWAKPEGKGYGKKLYMAALETAGKKGAMLAPAKNSTSDSASNVWRSLYRDSRIEKTPLSPKDWPQTGRINGMLAKYPDLRFSDPNTYPPKTDAEFWTFGSGYRLGSGTNIAAASAPQMVRRQWPTLTNTGDSSGLEDL